MHDIGWFGSISFDSFPPTQRDSTRYDFGCLGWIYFDDTLFSALLSIDPDRPESWRSRG
jgi:hypothetical protein